MTAVIAAELVPSAKRMLDIGAGIGSVGLMTLYKLPSDAVLTMIELKISLISWPNEPLLTTI